MAKPSTGLILHTKSVEVIELSGRPGAAARVAVSGETDAHLVEAIQAACDRVKRKGKSVAISLPTQYILLRCFTLPLLPKTEWEQAIHFLDNDYFGDSANEQR